ncbi:hypothetical protein [Chryseobacterium arthrosphaerae]|uniref:hypothetical protein n=1 Tax=Chryseobacterium arthrosphaerae TaxID=651561 RepID=UPI00142DE191|nr:hypothetical protein [Chryseobacterium arthrosphaerae]
MKENPSTGRTRRGMRLLLDILKNNCDMKYKIVTVNSAQELEKAVNLLLDLGW